MQMLNWLAKRMTERTTLDGAVLVAAVKLMEGK